MTLFSSQPGDEGLPGPARARVIAAIMTTTLMGVFDGTMINIALPSMAQEMQVPAGIAVWFANGYLLAAAMTLAIFAALAARLGYRPVFLAPYYSERQSPDQPALPEDSATFFPA